MGLSIVNDCTDEELELAERCATRAKTYWPDIDALGLLNDILATNLKFKLKLNELVNADLENFAHDIQGIYHNFDRATLTMQNQFHPRFAENALEESDVKSIEQLVRHGFGLLAHQAGYSNYPLVVLRSSDGYYIGTADPYTGPVSRESDEHFDSFKQADDALKRGDWTQRTSL